MGASIGGAYTDPVTGFYGTPDQHTAYQNQLSYAKPYDASSASAGAASTANKSAFGDANTTGVDYTIDPTGKVSYSNASEQQRITDAAKRDSFLSLLSSNPSAPSAPTVQPSNVQGNEADARAAAFARAKDQAGKIARSSLTSISENLAGRNMSGGGLQALRESGAIQGSEEPLQQLTRDQLVSDTNRAADVSDMSYQGAITQRGQDLANRASYLSLLRSLY
jgi:hypothetical protein